MRPHLQLLLRFVELMPSSDSLDLDLSLEDSLSGVLHPETVLSKGKELRKSEGERGVSVLDHSEGGKDEPHILESEQLSLVILVSHDPSEVPLLHRGVVADACRLPLVDLTAGTWRGSVSRRSFCHVGKNGTYRA